MAIAKARILQWSHVWPLSKQEKARQTAREIASYGKLEIKGVEDWHVGFVLLLVIPLGEKTGWFVKFRPVHFGGYDAKTFDFNQLRFIEFEYCHRGVTERHFWDPSTYLSMKNVG